MRLLGQLSPVIDIFALKFIVKIATGHSRNMANCLTNDY